LKPDQPFAIDVLRAAAREITEQAAYYRSRESQALAQRWRRAVNAAIASLAFSPLRGNTFHLATLPQIELRRIPIEGFLQHGVYYQAFIERRLVVVVTVLHGARDPSRLLAASRFPK
jgi:plasmid stabilization system protein ParE